MKDNSCKWYQAHIWSKWEQTGSGPTLSFGRRTGFWLRQERTCERCGFKQIRVTEV